MESKILNHIVIKTYTISQKLTRNAKYSWNRVGFPQSEKKPQIIKYFLTLAAILNIISIEF